MSIISAAKVLCIDSPLLESELGNVLASVQFSANKSVAIFVFNQIVSGGQLAEKVARVLLLSGFLFRDDNHAGPEGPGSPCTGQGLDLKTMLGKKSSHRWG